jgi:hypothetical protein
MPIDRSLRYLKEVSWIPNISRIPFCSIPDTAVSKMPIDKSLRYLKEVSWTPTYLGYLFAVSQMLLNLRCLFVVSQTLGISDTSCLRYHKKASRILKMRKQRPGSGKEVSRFFIGPIKPGRARW